MTKFVTLSMILDTRIEPNMDEHSGADELPFLSWTIGHKVKSNGSDDTIWKISRMTTSNDEEVTRMTYFLTVHLVDTANVDNVKTVRSATLQTGYSIVQLGEDDDLLDAPPVAELIVEPAIPTKPVTIAVETIRTFYPRKDSKPGTRVILKSGVAYVVLETHDQVLAKVS